MIDWALPLVEEWIWRIAAVGAMFVVAVLFHTLDTVNRIQIKEAFDVSKASYEDDVSDTVNYLTKRNAVLDATCVEQSAELRRLKDQVSVADGLQLVSNRRIDELTQRDAVLKKKYNVLVKDHAEKTTEVHELEDRIQEMEENADEYDEMESKVDTLEAERDAALARVYREVTSTRNEYAEHCARLIRAVRAAYGRRCLSSEELNDLASDPNRVATELDDLLYSESDDDDDD